MGLDPNHPLYKYGLATRLGEPPKQSVISRVIAHPFTLAIVTGVFGIACAVVGAVVTSMLGNAGADHAQIGALEERLTRITDERDALFDQLTALQEQVMDDASASVEPPHNESLAIPVGSFIGMMDRTYITYVEKVRSGTATIQIRDLTGSSEQYYVRPGNRILLFPEGRRCALNVDHVDANVISISTECVRISN